MSFRIDSINVNRGGPLDRDFEFSPGELNLIYGPNESGKTYVIESLIKFLFKDKKLWKSRRLGGNKGGVIMVSGLEDEPIAFREESERKLDKFWEDEAGLPSALSRLLVVRAGETRLSEKEGDGVGRSILKECLSGTSLLDKIDNRIKVTIKKATIPRRGEITGDLRSPLTTRTKLLEQAAELQDLQDRVQKEYMSSERCSLQQKKEELEFALDALKRARRYHAWNLSDQKHEVDRQIKEMPSGQELGGLESDIQKHWENEKKLTLRSQRIAELEETGARLRRAEPLLDRYAALSSSSGDGELGDWSRTATAVTAFISIAMIVFSVWRGNPSLLITGSILIAISLFLGYRNFKKSLGQSGISAEQEHIRSEYRDIFDSELADIEALSEKKRELRDNYVLVEQLKKEVKEFSQAKTDLEADIANRLKTWTGDEVPVEKFKDTQGRLNEQREELQNQLYLSSNKLDQVGVPIEEYLDEDPGESWDPVRHDKIEDQLADRRADLSQIDRNLEGLKNRVIQQTRLPDEKEWPPLIKRLDDMREKEQDKYRELTADILARMKVHEAIAALRKEEDMKIDAGLKEDSLTGLLYSVTGRYQKIRQVGIDGGKQLAVIPDDDGEYLLKDMSTGVREQILLALRMSFASRVMGGRTGFLILDDAFQHSDYSRRKRLVDQTVQHVRNGWQVFYFTMDDHIRGLFREVGEEMPNKFKETDLPAVISST